MDEPVYVVTEGVYEDIQNVLLTASLGKAIKRYVEGFNNSTSIQIWRNEKLIHEYGIYVFENIQDYKMIYSKIKYVEENGFDKYLQLHK